MGHYYAEMCCPDCGRMRCACPETLERERKYARMSWEEKQKEKREGLLKAIELAEKMKKEQKNND